MSTLGDSRNEISVSVVGIRGQAARHIELIKRSSIAQLQHVFYPDESYVNEHSSIELPLTHELDDCAESEVIIIASPTTVHFSQLEALENFQGYIFLEKPAVMEKEEIAQLLKYSDDRKSRIKVNFNFQSNPIARTLSSILDCGLIGQPIHATFETNHGGAFKPGWATNWRSTNRHSGPNYTVGIHYVQWLTSKFGTPSSTVMQESSFSGNSVVDTGVVHMKWEKGFFANIATSYASALKINFQITGTDGYAIYDGTSLKLFSPRDSFDDEGLFTFPPESKLLDLPWSTAYAASVENSQIEFFEHVKRGTLADSEQFDRDVQTVPPLIRS